MDDLLVLILPGAPSRAPRGVRIDQLVRPLPAHAKALPYLPELLPLGPQLLRRLGPPLPIALAHFDNPKKIVDKGGGDDTMGPRINQEG